VTKVSISRAWEETRTAISADGRLFIAVALALIVLPAALLQFAFPGAAVTQSPRSTGETVGQLLAWVLGLIGQLAIARLALARGESVGSAMGEATRQMPWLVVAMMLLLMGLFVLFIPIAMLLYATGVSLPQDAAGLEQSPAVLVASLLFAALVVFVAARMMMTTPVAAVEGVGPVGIIRRSWALTRGNVLRLIGFLLLFGLAVFVLMAAVMLLTNTVIALFTGTVEAFTVAALLQALIRATLSGLVTTVLTLMLARIYIQLRSGGEDLEVSVPSSGG
jgi:membrane-anchored glycerophosphoryl diester phosphodiesterase (GDPDase)